MTTYEQLLARDFDWALQQGSLHFEEQSAVHQALRKVARRLDEGGIPYAVAGGMALFFHGFRRFTEDVDVLVTPAGLKTAHRDLEGLGYVSASPGSKQLRDTESGVRIDFLVTGQYPVGGKPKPAVFSDPAAVSEERNGIRFVRLPMLVELKLASGMTSPGRLTDLADVQRLIQILSLPAALADQLNPYVRDQYRQLWTGLQSGSSEPWPLSSLSPSPSLTFSLSPLSGSSTCARTSASESRRRGTWRKSSAKVAKA